VDDGGVFKEAMLARSAVGSSEMAVSNNGQDDKEREVKKRKGTDGEVCLPLRRKEDGGGRRQSRERAWRLKRRGRRGQRRGSITIT